MNSHVIKFFSEFNNTVGTRSIFIGSLRMAAVTEALQYREAFICCNCTLWSLWGGWK